MKKFKFTKVICAISICFAVILASIFIMKCHIHTYGEEMPVGKNTKGYAFLKVCKNCGKGKTVYYDALLTFVDDDGKLQALQHWERIMDATGIKTTAALITSKITNTTDFENRWAYAGWDEIQRLKEKGMDFVNHSHNHQKLTSLTEEELRLDLETSKSILAKHGIKSSILVYPNNSRNETVDSVVKDYFSAAFCGKGVPVEKTISESFDLPRVNLNDKNSTKKIAFTSKTTAECHGIKSLKKMKSELKSATKANGWLVYMAHAYDSPKGKFYFDEQAEKTVIKFCKFVNSRKNVKIVTLTEGLAASKKIK